MTLNRNSIVVRWAYLFESVPRATNLCPFFWRCVLWTPVKLVFVPVLLFLRRADRFVENSPRLQDTLVSIAETASNAMNLIAVLAVVAFIVVCLLVIDPKALLILFLMVVGYAALVGLIILAKEGLVKAYMLAKRVGLCPLIQIK